jgi:hypothetical protein
MTSPIDMPPIRKALAFALIAAGVIVVLEFVGVGPMVRESGSAVSAQVKSLFTRLFSRPASGT